MAHISTLQGTNISPKNGILKMIFLFPRWDMLIPWRVCLLVVFAIVLRLYVWNRVFINRYCSHLEVVCHNFEHLPTCSS